MNRRIVDRPLYLKKLIDWKHQAVIKVITGMRRSGKSTLLELFKEHLSSQGIMPSLIHHINFEDLAFEQLLDTHAIYNYLMQHKVAGHINYVLLDEVQMVPHFEKVIDSLQLDSEWDIYITGSNALLLSGNLATLLSGRYIEINILPLSFKEYFSAYREDLSLSRQRLFMRYLVQGGMPGVLALSENTKMQYEYLQGIYNTVLVKDIVQRLKTNNVSALEALAKFLLDNIGNLTSPKHIADIMSAQGTHISLNTVISYLDALCASYLFYPSQRFDVRGSKLLARQEKYYAADLGLRQLLTSESRDLGRMLENVIYLELKRRYQQVFVGVMPKGEIDFVCQDAAGTRYIQVAQSVLDPKTLERELAPLQSLANNYPKTLITLDETDPISYAGIMQVNAIDWLLDTH